MSDFLRGGCDPWAEITGPPKGAAEWALATFPRDFWSWLKMIRDVSSYRWWTAYTDSAYGCWLWLIWNFFGFSFAIVKFEKQKRKLHGTIWNMSEKNYPPPHTHTKVDKLNLLNIKIRELYVKMIKVLKVYRPKASLIKRHIHFVEEINISFLLTLSSDKWFNHLVAKIKFRNFENGCWKHLVVLFSWNPPKVYIFSKKPNKYTISNYCPLTNYLKNKLIRKTLKLGLNWITLHSTSSDEFLQYINFVHLKRWTQLAWFYLITCASKIKYLKLLSWMKFV